MLQRTEGVVLSTSEYGDADLIATFLTRDFGLVRAFVKSPRKTKSRFGSSLEPLSHSRISFWGREDSSLPRLTQCDLLHPFAGLRTTLRTYLKILECVELTLALVPERDVTGGVYGLLLETLHALEKSGSDGLHLLAYRVRLLARTGFLPGLERCGRCGRSGASFHLSQGTVLCGACSVHAADTVTVDAAVTGLCRSLMEWEMQRLDRLKPGKETAQALAGLLAAHARHITGRKLKTAEFRRG